MMFILCLDVSLLFLPLGWIPNLSPFFCMNSGSCSHLVRLQPSAHDAVLTRMRWHYAMLGPQWCRYGSIPPTFFLDEHPELQFIFGVNRRNQKGARVLSHSCKDVFLLMTIVYS